MYYVRTADRLQRTAPWLESVEGGIDAVRAVVFDDSLGIAADLDAAMAAHVDDYEDEWAATLADEEKLRRSPRSSTPPRRRTPISPMSRSAASDVRPTSAERAVLIAGREHPGARRRRR